MPRKSTDKFWGQQGLNGDGEFSNSILLEVVGFGSTVSESKGNAMVKLLQLIELVRALVHQLSSTWQSKAIPVLQFDSEVLERVQFAMMEVSSSMIYEGDLHDSNEALKMASDLSHLYKDPRSHIEMGQGKWKRIIRVLEDYLERFPPLRPLLLYYLVTIPPPSPSINMLFFSKKFLLHLINNEDLRGDP